ncbi:hypothetical protein IG631_22726 [Alternaria alternata]|nr:hypothetical protein IG631_22726 [Alternaria alternata]
MRSPLLRLSSSGLRARNSSASARQQRVDGMCSTMAAQVGRGNIRTTTRVSPGRQPSVWERCAMITGALQDWFGLGVYASSLQSVSVVHSRGSSRYRRARRAQQLDV